MSTNGIFVIIATLAVIGISFTFATLAGRKSRKDAALLTIVVPFGWLISNLVAFAKMYTQITDIPLAALILVMTLLSLLFVMPACMKLHALRHTTKCGKKCSA